MMLTKIQIKNYRSIKDSGRIKEITKIFSLIGRNNTGKSSFLKALQVLMADRVVLTEDFHKNTEEAININGTIGQYNDSGEWEEIQLSVTIKKEEKLKEEYRIDGKEISKTAYKKSVPEILSIDDIRNPEDSKAEGQKATLLNKIMKLPKQVDDEKYKQLSKDLIKLKQKEAEEISKKITDKFQSVIGEKNFEITVTPNVDIDKGTAHHTDLIDKDIPGSLPVNILNSGTGLQSMYILALLELWAELSEVNDNAILLVEEPEVYLHPTYQRRMFSALRRIAENNQVIFTTHSPIMISDIWLTRSVRQILLNADGETEVKSVKVENVIDELGIRYEDVLNPKLVVFVEGKDDIKFYEKLGIENSGTVKLIPSDGFRAIHYYAFIKIMSSEHVKNDFVILSDSDGRQPAIVIKDLVDSIMGEFGNPPENFEEELGKKIFPLRRYESESYFLDFDLLKKCLPDLEASDKELKDFLKGYQQRLKVTLSEVESGKKTLQAMQRYIKPKYIFESHKNEMVENVYKEFWGDVDNFIKVKDEIASRCSNLDSWFEHFLTKLDIDNPELVEVKEFVNNKLAD